MTIFHFIRHGEIERNIKGELPGYDDVLTNTGRGQAKESAKILSETLKSPAHMFYSPMPRAAETAEIIASILKDTELIISKESDARIQEASFGSLEGMTWLQVDQQNPNQSITYINQDYDFTLQEGDSFQIVKDRVYGFIQDIKTRYPNQEIVVVAHGGIIRCIYKVEQDKIFDKVPANASIHAFEF